MEHLIGHLTIRLTEFFGEDKRRIEHALLVLHHSLNLCAERTDVDRDIVIAAALLHDVGIKPAEAKKLLQSIDFPSEKTRIVCNIIGNHHSPSRFDNPELELLKKADAIVNRIDN